MGTAAAADGFPGHIVTSVTEHVAVKATMTHLQSNGHEVTYVSVLPDGRVPPEAVAAAILPTTRLVTLMLANVREVARCCCR